MPLIPLLIGSSTALGIGYFCVDVYRNRHRLSQKSAPKVGLNCYETAILPDDVDFHAVGETVNHTSHGIGEAATESISSVLD
jgi:hypothetical protein